MGRTVEAGTLQRKGWVGSLIMGGGVSRVVTDTIIGREWEREFQKCKIGYKGVAYNKTLKAPRTLTHNRMVLRIKLHVYPVTQAQNSERHS